MKTIIIAVLILVASISAKAQTDTTKKLKPAYAAANPNKAYIFTIQLIPEKLEYLQVTLSSGINALMDSSNPANKVKAAGNAGQELINTLYTQLREQVVKDSVAVARAKIKN